jgi:ionotropic glutamate receptor
MYRIMTKNADEVMVSSNKQGIDKVLREQGGYAFFMESTTIEYVVERYCELQQIGGLLDSKSYGIALQHGKYIT